MDLNNPARARCVDKIVASSPDHDRAKAIQSLAALDLAIEQQQRFDTAVAAALGRILANAPAEALRPLAKQLRKRIREISSNGR